MATGLPRGGPATVTVALFTLRESPSAVVPRRWFVTPLGATESFCGGSDGLSMC